MNTNNPFIAINSRSNINLVDALDEVGEESDVDDGVGGGGRLDGDGDGQIDLDADEDGDDAIVWPAPPNAHGQGNGSHRRGHREHGAGGSNTRHAGNHRSSRSRPPPTNGSQQHHTSSQHRSRRQHPSNHSTPSLANSSSPSHAVAGPSSSTYNVHAANAGSSRSASNRGGSLSSSSSTIRPDLRIPPRSAPSHVPQIPTPHHQHQSRSGEANSSQSRSRNQHRHRHGNRVNVGSGNGQQQSPVHSPTGSGSGGSHESEGDVVFPMTRGPGVVTASSSGHSLASMASTSTLTRQSRRGGGNSAPRSPIVEDQSDVPPTYDSHVPTNNRLRALAASEIRPGPSTASRDIPGEIQERRIQERERGRQQAAAAVVVTGEESDVPVYPMTIDPRASLANQRPQVSPRRAAAQAAIARFEASRSVSQGAQGNRNGELTPAASEPTTEGSASDDGNPAGGGGEYIRAEDVLMSSASQQTISAMRSDSNLLGGGRGRSAGRSGAAVGLGGAEDNGAAPSSSHSSPGGRRGLHQQISSMFRRANGGE